MVDQAQRPGSTSTTGAARPAGLLERRTRWLRLHPGGLAVGTAFAVLAMTPSLLPRDWLFQGVVSGISAAGGYGVGVAAAWLLRRWSRWQAVASWVDRRATPARRRLAWAGLLLACVAVTAVMLVVAADWQREVAALVGTDPTTTSGWSRVGPLLLLVAAVLLLLARVVREVARLVARFLRRFVRLPQTLSSAGGLLVTGTLLVVLLDDVVLQQALEAADAVFEVSNSRIDEDVEQPTDARRSGSPDSLVAWETLGDEGRRFVAGGRSPAALAEASGRVPRVPIRAYVGLDSADTDEERAELAVAELERTGAYDREVVVVVTTTGTGWVNSAASDGVELLYGGDTAVVATQYSYLPSWLSFVVDRERAQEAGRALFDAVHARIEELPEQDRPLLLVYGESLGSLGSEAAFSSLADVRAQADGVLWVGPPGSNEVWSALVDRRDPGSTMVEPTYADGLVVRFASDPEDLVVTGDPWLDPRVLYLQHPSDPIVWWSPSLLWQRPDWLVEPRGDDVSPAMSWYPLVTFWQVSADMTNAQSVPDGHGHNYGGLMVDAWAAVAAPEGWTAADTDRAREVLTG